MPHPNHLGHRRLGAGEPGAQAAMLDPRQGPDPGPDRRPDPGPGLTVERRSHGRREIVALAGELDLSTVAELEAGIEEACSNGAGELVLDLEELSFMDSTGLSAILTTQDRCAGQGCELLLSGAQPAVHRLFELTGVLSCLRFLEPPA
jgi:anti-anti-sigma factor